MNLLDYLEGPYKNSTISNLAYLLDGFRLPVPNNNEFMKGLKHYLFFHPSGICFKIGPINHYKTHDLNLKPFVAIKIGQETVISGERQQDIYFMVFPGEPPGLTQDEKRFLTSIADANGFGLDDKNENFGTLPTEELLGFRLPVSLDIEGFYDMTINKTAKCQTDYAGVQEQLFARLSETLARALGRTASCFETRININDITFDTDKMGAFWDEAESAKEAGLLSATWKPDDIRIPYPLNPFERATRAFSAASQYAKSIASHTQQKLKPV